MPSITALPDVQTRPAPRPTAATASRAKAKAEPSHGERLGGLDGLRAVAVAAVVLFHLDSDLVPGGFLGVDVFFVISGFLITRLLLTELHRADTHRSARVLPCVGRDGCFPRWLCSPSRYRPPASSCGVTNSRRFAGNVLSSLGYVTNWWLILDHQSYFVSSRPPAACCSTCGPWRSKSSTTCCGRS